MAASGVNPNCIKATQLTDIINSRRLIDKQQFSIFTKTFSQAKGSLKKLRPFVHNFIQRILKKNI